SESLKFHFQEEEHLLESPYQTNCTDYEDLWEKNNKSGPRSQEMCREWCLINTLKPCIQCEEFLKMVEKPTRICEYIGRFFSIRALRIMDDFVSSSRSTQNSYFHII
ncbi:hypothetical protein NPIL_414161, partial [Nephila pilipes]